MKKIIKVILLFLAVILILSGIIYCYFFLGSASTQSNITWGVDFSQMQAESLNLDWKQTYLAMIGDLNTKNIKLHTQWDWVEGKKDDYFFNDIDWQIKQAEQRDVKVIYVVGMKTGRWPECHMPSWTKNLSKEQVQEQLLEYTKKVILRYKNSKAVTYWQVENEPLFRFGECPEWYYDNDSFLKKEVALVKSLDPSRQVIISDSGEQSSWFGVAKVGDIVGITMYRSAWAHVTDKFGFKMNSFLNPITYLRKAGIINKIFGKKVICIELQAEPWASVAYGASAKEQEKTMNFDQFVENVEYAKQTGLDTFYFWGVEWWYWMKTVQNQPQIWNEVKSLLNE